jgi:ABC-2 type transport system ATP-binding protein
MTTALVIRELTKTYNNGFQALKGINLTVQQGDFYALVRAKWGREIDHDWHY